MPPYLWNPEHLKKGERIRWFNNQGTKSSQRSPSLGGNGECARDVRFKKKKYKQKNRKEKNSKEAERENRRA